MTITLNDKVIDNVMKLIQTKHKSHESVISHTCILYSISINK